MTIAAKSSTKPAPSQRVKPGKVNYPTGDGKPMAEDTKHRCCMSEFLDAMDRRYADPSSLYVAGNDFVYYEEGNPQARVSPDAYIARVAKGYRPNYKVWEEEQAPCFVLEFTSKKTKKEDMGRKFTLYEQVLKVEEYVLFDPEGDYLKPRLQGFLLVDGRYVQMPQEEDFTTGNSEQAPESGSSEHTEVQPAASDALRNATGWLYSKTLNLYLVPEGERLRLWDPIAQSWLKTSSELEMEAKEQMQRAEKQAQRAQAAEAELARLRAELERLRQREP